MSNLIIKIIILVIYPTVTFFLISQTYISAITGFILALTSILLLSKIPYRKNFVKAIADVSILCDDRINDIADSGLFNRIIVPDFALKETYKRHFSKNLDNNLKKLKSKKIVKISKRKYRNIKSTEFKTLQFAKDIKARIITADFNIKKMADLRGIEVTDINDLYERLQPVILPGCKVCVFLVKEGKERSQAIGFLNNGTTVVAENGKTHINTRVTVKITSVLHSSTNKIVFGKVLEENIGEK